jgi:ketosteroid isomerase-like protein
MTLEERIQHLEDIEAIKKLKARYCALCDENYDADGLAILFTPDAVWDGGQLGVCRGREEIRLFFQKSPRAISFAIHQVTNPIIDVDGDSATGSWYLFQPCTFARSERAMWMAATYRDRYVRSNDEWLFAHVEISVRFMTPFDEGWAKTPIASF